MYGYFFIKNSMILVFWMLNFGSYMGTICYFKRYKLPIRDFYAEFNSIIFFWASNGTIRDVLVLEDILSSL